MCTSYQVNMVYVYILYIYISIQVRAVVPIGDRGSAEPVPVADRVPDGGDSTNGPPNSVEPVPVADGDPSSTNGDSTVSGGNAESPYEAWHEWLTDAQPHDPFHVPSTPSPAKEINNGDPKEI